MRYPNPPSVLLCTLGLALASGCLAGDDAFEDDDYGDVDIGESQSELDIGPIIIDWVQRPKITSISPSSARPGETVTVTGVNFNRTEQGYYYISRWGMPWGVRLGSRTVSFQVISATELRFTVPTGTSGGNVALRSTGSTVDFTRSSQVFLTAPDDLVATMGSASSINLSWHDNANNETAYEIWMNDGTWRNLGTVGANHTSEPITELPPQTTRTFRVRAVRSGIYSAWSNTANASTGQAPTVTFSNRTLLSTLLDGPAWISRGANGEVLAYGILDTNGDGIVAGAPGFNSNPASIYPRWRGNNCGVYNGARFAPNANLILFLQVETWSNGRPQYVAVHANMSSNGVVNFATVAAGDLNASYAGTGGEILGANSPPSQSLAVSGGVADGWLTSNLFSTSCGDNIVSGGSVSIDLADGIPVFNE